jgi:hypothetical protein
MNDLRKFAADKAAALVEKHRANTTAGRRKDAEVADTVGGAVSRLVERLRQMLPADPKAFASQAVQRPLEQVSSRFKEMTPETQRLVLGGVGGAGIGGLLGLQGATSKKDAERSRLMDMLRGATAGGLAGGGLAVGYNALTGDTPRPKAMIEGVGEIDARDAVSRLDAARSGEPGPILNAANDFGVGKSLAVGTGGGAAIGGASEAIDRLGPAGKQKTFLENLLRLAKESPDDTAKKEYQKLYAALSSDNRKIPGLLKELRKHQTPGWRPWRSASSRPTYMPGASVPDIDPVRSYIDKTLGDPTITGQRRPFLDASSSIGRDSFKPMPGGTARPHWARKPGAGAIGGLGLAAGALLAPTVASMFPSRGLGNEEVLEALRKGK